MNDLSWLGGLIDGEGSFFFRVWINHRKNLVINGRFSISLTEGNWSTVIETILKDRDIHYAKRKRMGQTEISIGGPHLKRFSQIIRPHLVIKKRHAEIMVKFPSRNRNQYSDNRDIFSKQLELFDELSKMNVQKNRKRKWTKDSIMGMFEIDKKGHVKRKR